MIVARAPYRLSLFGGGTDYPSYFLGRGTTILTAALNHHCYATVKFLPPFFPTHSSRIVWSRIELVSDSEQIVHPTVRACLKRLGISHGVEIHHSGDLPARSGVGSSSAFTVALLSSLGVLVGKSHSQWETGLAAIDVEQNFIRENVGIQDQITAAMGGLSIIEIDPEGQLSRRPLSLSRKYLKQLENSILLGFYGESRNSSEFSSLAVDGIRSGRDLASLDATRSLAVEAMDLLAQEGPLVEVGRLLNEGWKLKRTLYSDGGSLDAMARLIDRAVKLGAWGGKLMGAGGSGFFYLLAEPAIHEQIKAALGEVKLWVPASFDHQGCVAFDLSLKGEEVV